MTNEFDPLARFDEMKILRDLCLIAEHKQWGSCRVRFSPFVSSWVTHDEGTTTIFANFDHDRFYLSDFFCNIQIRIVFDVSFVGVANFFSIMSLLVFFWSWLVYIKIFLWKCLYYLMNGYFQSIAWIYILLENLCFYF